jgi:glycosyltransferase involved in cell wall biosynthesis
MSVPSGTPRVVSVVVPTRDRPDTLREALASIRAHETPDTTFEIIVGDNGTLPETRALAEEFGARHIVAPRPGASVARNVALEAATGEFIAFLDDDDVWMPGHMQPHLELLDRRPEIDAAFSQYIYTKPDLTPISPPTPEKDPGEGPELLRRMLGGFFPQIGTLVIRASARDYAGWFDEKLIGGQDLDWMLRFARRNVMAYVEAPSILFRSRPRATYDALQLRRVRFDRTVFFRHAVPAWRVWRSPLEFMRAYHGTIRHFYWYFEDAAHQRSHRGDVKGTFAAIAGAFQVYPLRALFHLVANRPLRRAAVTVLFRSPSEPPVEETGSSA